uniref:Methyltransferase type 11 domain-containing protein n=1 Tax=viral metagenome TaxID=1070528 RepID=A0A6C0APU4_9ZZZZ
MHDTAATAGKLFAEVYGGFGKVVVDIGGKNVNGSLRSAFENLGMKYICVDLEEDESVDIVIKPTDKLPFENGSVDLIVSTSCFEHDPCFWITFKEMTRILKRDGFIYINAPTNGPYHCYPGDNWRFYSDAGQALSYWSSYKFSNEQVFPVKVVETFHILPKRDMWLDFICVWKATDEIQKDITVSKSISQNIGILEKTLNDNGYKTKKKC